MGCGRGKFNINAPHVLQVDPGRFKAFKDQKLATLAFQEYHASYPHKKYTLGMASRPAGPSFYVNKMDNVANHGPGGQGHHVLEEEGEPCFARVVYGFQALNAVAARPVKGSRFLLDQPVLVTSTVLLPREYVPPDEKPPK